MDQKTKAIIRKRNMKLYPIYEMLGLDFMFYYVIELLFFVQVKGIAVADVVLLESFYAAFSIFMQFIVVVIASKIGKKKGMLLGNVLNLLQLLMIMLGNNFAIFVVAKMVNAMAFGIKNITESTFLNSTIPKTKKHGEIFSKIDGKGYSKYSYFRAITTLMAGVLFEINPYIPMILCATCVVFAIIIAMNFNEIEEDDKKLEENKDSFKNLKQGFVFIFKSKRLKALLVMIAIIWALLCIESTYRTAILKDIGISASMIGMINALIEVIKGIYATKANQFNKKYSNKLLTMISLCITFIMILYGGITLINIDYRIQAMLITILCTLIYVCKGIYQIVKKRYMANFVKPDTLLKIYSANSIIDNLVRMLVSYIASVTLNFMNIRYASLFIGTLFTAVVILISLYMKDRVGLKPENYDSKEIEVIK